MRLKATSVPLDIIRLFLPTSVLSHRLFCSVVTFHGLLNNNFIEATRSLEQVFHAIGPVLGIVTDFTELHGHNQCEKFWTGIRVDPYLRPVHNKACT